MYILQVQQRRALETNFPQMLEKQLLYQYDTHEVLHLSWWSQVK